MEVFEKRTPEENTQIADFLFEALDGICPKAASAVNEACDKFGLDNEEMAQFLVELLCGFVFGNISGITKYDLGPDDTTPEARSAKDLLERFIGKTMFVGSSLNMVPLQEIEGVDIENVLKEANDGLRKRTNGTDLIQ